MFTDQNLTPDTPSSQTSTPMAQSQPVHTFNYSNQSPAETPTMMAAAKGSPSMKKASAMFLPLCIIVIVAGVLTGIGLDKLNAKGNGNTFQGQTIVKTATDVAAIQNGQVFGSANETSFKDSAEGYLVAGGIDGEGTEHLVRPGGVSQTVYLTSSVTDLSKFEGMQVKVWGETFKGQKAGWLMDVGRVQVQDTKAQAPTEQ